MLWGLPLIEEDKQGCSIIDQVELGVKSSWILVGKCQAKWSGEIRKSKPKQIHGFIQEFTPLISSTNYKYY